MYENVWMNDQELIVQVVSWQIIDNAKDLLTHLMQNLRHSESVS